MPETTTDAQGAAPASSLADTVFGAAQPRFLARWIGTLMVVAAALGAVTLPLPTAPYGSNSGEALVSVLVGLGGIAFLSGIADRASLWLFAAMIAASSALVDLACYFGGSPMSGASFFYLWAISAAFAFFSLRIAVAQLAFAALGYGGVLLLQHHLHPAMAAGGPLVTVWFTTMATVTMVGLFIRRISRSHRDVDRRMQRAFSDSPIPSAFLTTDLAFQQLNAAMADLLDRPCDALVARSLLAVVHPEDRPTAQAVLAGVREHTVRHDLRLLGPDGATIWASVSGALVVPEMGEPYLFIQCVDVTDHVQSRDALAARAIHDPLTGLFNRALLTDRLAAALRRRDQPGAVAVMMIDLDQFKVVNDSLGHDVGDELLSSVAPRLSGALGDSDTLARFGGDEFVVLCEEIRSPFDALERANRLADSLAGPVTLSTGEYTIAASIGVAVSTVVSDDGQSLLRDADAAMYRAKAAGRGRIEIFDQSMRDQAIARLELENDLRGAPAHGELILDFQPIVEAATGRVVYLEALVRWNHPQRGLLAPDEFIPLAEETGLIDEIGDFVLEQSLGLLSEWQRSFPSLPPFGVTVNVSGRQLLDASFAERVARMIRSSSILPSTFGIEITESVLLNNVQAPKLLNALRSFGVTIFLDDFGTGYSALAYLEQFAIDVLKVDRAFVARLDEGPHRTVVLEAILTMARALQLGVVAEGAEDEGRVHTLRALGCDWVQGFGVCIPLKAEDVPLYLEEQVILQTSRGPGRRG